MAKMDSGETVTDALDDNAEPDGFLRVGQE